jgi:DNA-binding response OmpR family regulator
LVVEDELNIAMMLEETLREAGCVVVGPAGRLDQALRLVQTERFDFAMLDVNLRGQFVFPVADIMVSSGIPFVFLTGYGLDTLPPRFAGSPILCKPFRLMALLQIIGEQLAPAH